MTDVMSMATRIRRWVAFGLVLGLSLLAPLAHAAETVTYYYTNQQGTPLATADAAGNVLSTSDYKPYGAQVLGSAASGPGYTGHVNDPDSGLVYMQARYYDPVIGRFLSTDPQDVTVGNVQAFGLYEYANLNPVGNVDPDGRETIAFGLGGTVAGLLGVTGARQVTLSMDGLKVSTFNVGYYNAAGGTASTAVGPSANLIFSYSRANSAEEMADTGGTASAGGGVNIVGLSAGYEQSLCDQCNPIRTLSVGGKIPQLPFEAHVSMTQSAGYTIFGTPPSPKPTVKVGEPQPVPPPKIPPPSIPLVPSNWTFPIM